MGGFLDFAVSSDLERGEGGMVVRSAKGRFFPIAVKKPSREDCTG
jgi:hypothetical protein